MKIRFLLLFSLGIGALYALDSLKTTTIQRYYLPVLLFLEGTSVAMPAEKYGFKLVLSTRNSAACPTREMAPVEVAR